MSNAERQKRYRDNKRNAPVTETVTRVTPEPDRNAPTVTPVAPGITVATVTLEQLDKGLKGGPSLEHYAISPEKYAHRAHPDELNWGPRMDSQQLAQAGFKANRVPVPGDWDYNEGS